ncbi:MAG TPA: ABC transporter substrate-binding protein [Polyangia bacterium]|nr:ABC transporter substrate-binding protein [Polyangia bacterium]
MTRPAVITALVAAALVGGAGCRQHGGGKAAAPTTLRLGFFANLTHAPALVGLLRGDFARALAPLTVDAKPFNAGPQAMEALFAGALDACYVGPAPALNGYLRSHGEALVVVAGAALDGAGLVVRTDAGIRGPADLHGKKLASPQLGNTQDVALRMYLKDNGLASKDRGGDVQVMPLANADILALMKQKQLDGAWVPEPWTTRLVDEAGGTLLVDERDRWPDKKFPTTVLVVTKKLASEHPEIVQKLVDANVATIAWMKAHPDEARKLVDTGLQKWAKKALPEELLKKAYANVQPSPELLDKALMKQLADGRALGFLPDGDISGLIDRRFADEAGKTK